MNLSENDLALIQKNFDYSMLDNSTADYLKLKEFNIREIVGKASTEVGKELKEAQDKLAGKNQYNGMFEQWYSAIGYKKQTVYNLINRYNLLVQHLDKRNELEALPDNLLYEAGKKTAPSQVVQAVLNGDIKTHKEYKELESRLKEAQKRSEQLDEQNWNLQQKLKNVVTGEQLEAAKREAVERVQEDLGADIDDLSKRLKQTEAKYNLAIQQNSEQSEKYNRQIEELKKAKSESPEVKKKLAELENKLKQKEDELANLTRAQLHAKDKFVVHNTFSSFAQQVGSHLKKLEFEIIKYPGDPDMQKDISAAIETLERAVETMKGWQEVSIRKGDVIDGEFTVIA